MEITDAAWMLELRGIGCVSVKTRRRRKEVGISLCATICFNLLQPAIASGFYPVIERMHLKKTVRQLTYTNNANVHILVFCEIKLPWVLT